MTTSGFSAANATTGDTITITGTDGAGDAQTATLTFGDGSGGTIDASLSGDALASAIQTATDATFGAGNVTVANASGELTVGSTTGDVTFAFNDADGSGSITTLSTVGGEDGTAFEAEVVAVEAVVFSAQSVADAINADAANTGDAAVVASVDGDGNLALSSAGGNLTAGDGDNVDVTGTGFVAGGNNFATNEDINNTLAAIDSALGTIRTAAATLGTNLSTIQIRSDFTQDLINTLEVGAGNLTLADLNEEGANLLTLQTRQQLASTSLSFATQADQSVLSLF